MDDDTLKDKIKERNRLYALKLRGKIEQVPDGVDRLRLLNLEVGKLRHQLKRSFFAEKLSKAGKNSKAAWRVLHDFIGKLGKGGGVNCRTFSCDGRVLTRDSDIAESFCEFFSNIGKHLTTFLHSS